MAADATYFACVMATLVTVMGQVTHSYMYVHPYFASEDTEY